VLTGAFRVGVSELLVLRAIEKASGVPSATLKHRTMGDWSPSTDFWQRLVATGDDAVATEPDRPYPFALAHPLDPIEGPAPLGPVDEWQIEWKWDGIRGQLVRREGIFVWSRGEELVTSQFPEIADAAQVLPKGTVLDGEVLPWSNGVLGFGDLQRRLNRKVISEKLREEVPIVFLAYDILEHEGADIRSLPLVERRARLDAVLDAHPHERLLRSTPIATDGQTWASLTTLREESRARNVEGFMLKRKTSAYGVGRKRGDWWKWKIDPYTVDAVLVYAQGGSGKRASLFSDYTFAVWTSAEEPRTLVTFAKAYSGLTDEEIKEVDAFVRKNTIEKFGPVRHVKPELVFEIGFEGIAESKRHKSGVAVRFPRMLRWRKDKPANEADTVDVLKALLK
jgi:DNA ligase 1